jgi:hypothetical protein
MKSIFVWKVPGRMTLRRRCRKDSTFSASVGREDGGTPPMPPGRAAAPLRRRSGHALRRRSGHAPAPPPKAPLSPVARPTQEAVAIPDTRRRRRDAGVRSQPGSGCATPGHPSHPKETMW